MLIMCRFSTVRRRYTRVAVKNKTSCISQTTKEMLRLFVQNINNTRHFQKCITRTNLIINVYNIPHGQLYNNYKTKSIDNN